MTANTRQVGGDHYKRMGVQPWEVIDAGPHEQAVGFHRWTAVAYLMRMGEKGSALEDAQKAGHVIEKLIEVLQRDQ